MCAGQLPLCCEARTVSISPARSRQARGRLPARVCSYSTVPFDLMRLQLSRRLSRELAESEKTTGRPRSVALCLRSVSIRALAARLASFRRPLRQPAWDGTGKMPATATLARRSAMKPASEMSFSFLLRVFRGRQVSNP